MPSQPISPRSILILSSHLCLGLTGGPFLSDFPTKILYAFLLLQACYMHHPLILLRLITLKTYGEAIIFIIHVLATKYGTVLENQYEASHDQFILITKYCPCVYFRFGVFMVLKM
jgi:hypothetical protein